MEWSRGRDEPISLDTTTVILELRDPRGLGRFNVFLGCGGPFSILRGDRTSIMSLERRRSIALSRGVRHGCGGENWEFG